MITVDSTFLSLLLHPTAKAPKDPQTGKPIERLTDRLDFLVEGWSTDREKVIIPTPVLSEFLILADKEGADYLTLIDRSANFRVRAFDERAAVELAAVYVNANASKSKAAKKREGAIGTWAKIKFDRQIVAIAKVNETDAIYTDDENLTKFAEQNGLTVVHTWQLPLPPPKPLRLPGMEEEGEEAQNIEPTIAPESVDGHSESEAGIETSTTEENLSKE
jgi:predicted nucleic acid-binding protein